MTDSSSDELVIMLRKAVSRTSLLAEGNDPKLDSIVRQIRQTITKGANAKEIQAVLSNAEPLLIQNDEVQLKRARLIRATLERLIDLLEKQEGSRVPQRDKKQLESQIRVQWQTSSQWPSLVKGFLSLAQKTLSTSEPEPPESRSSFLTRLFNRQESDGQQNTSNPNQGTLDSADIMKQVSHTLIDLLNNLALPSRYDENINDLEHAFTQTTNLQDLPGLLDEVVHLIMISVGKTQENLTNYLSQLNKQLASINESISSSVNSQANLSQSRENFNCKLQNQVTNTAEAVKKSNDLDSLKSLIDERLTTISETMEEHKTQMIEQERHANQSITQLKNKVTKMEKDTVSLRSLLQEKLAQAMTDSLTDLPNRTAYQDAILPLCKFMQKTKKPLCLAVCDIDFFKKVNDTWGHQAGDKVLRLVPKQIKNALAKEDLMFRYGGEEFVIVFPNTALKDAEARAEAVRRTVFETPFNMQGEPINISVSIGITQLMPQESPEALFSRADKQLYLAKESGRNKVVADK
ncbi:GGDEF domain-containing protein [Marinomonas algarum]|uniref:diguanylate cyclase n=1 Tax=Marinomonas algarum TaxID=2883105 RepID=A0A9X1IKK4_9GAMM|nr:GGDEF domain-containing protein [Marinomonas algarum]MCB5161229.1 GGDEF domain-containing protein [Marinomonas algarum]